MESLLKSNKEQLNLKKYDNIISLGYNCEVTLRFARYYFAKYYKQLESNLFNWTYSYSVEDLIYALQHIDLICSGDMVKPNPLWECKNTKFRFHGRAPITIWMSGDEIDDDFINADLAELRSRVYHLKNKFIITMTMSNLENLFVYKMRKSDVEQLEKGVKNINQLFESLATLSQNRFELLVVLEDCPMIIKLINLIDNEKIHIRTVKNFVSEHDVDSEEYDPSDWNLIFDEFQLK